MGSIGVAIYRADLADRLPADVPAGAAAIARDTLGSAVAVAAELPGQLGAAILEGAREAFAPRPSGRCGPGSEMSPAPPWSPGILSHELYQARSVG
jgi:hypothetical protein